MILTRILKSTSVDLSQTARIVVLPLLLEVIQSGAAVINSLMRAKVNQSIFMNLERKFSILEMKKRFGNTSLGGKSESLPDTLTV
ncbi:hypothetical protein M422DRAFT_243037 [Sphaerobolus stellatus SS14]|nr:hypothetical protein M422DRAFT_243037 [Sphaerobolus stellatus SS14]